jgi:hypothetical protein
VKPRSEEVSTQSRSIRVVGYEQTVTLKTTPEEFMAFFSDPSRLTPEGIEMEMPAPAARADLSMLGTTFPFHLKQLGISIQGRLILVRNEKSSLWLVWDNPHMFHIQRWQFKPDSGGTKLTLRVETEIPLELVELGLENTLDQISAELYPELDLMLAKIQAHFDPTLDPNELVSLGLRGEMYEALFQETEAQVFTRASRAEAAQWVLEANNFQRILPEFQVKEEDVAKLLQAERGSVVYFPVTYKSGMLELPTDVFTILSEDKNDPIIKSYFVISGYISVVELKTETTAGGVMITASFKNEVPGAMSSAGMDLMLLAAGIPKLLEERILMIKQGVEGQGPS